MITLRRFTTATDAPAYQGYLQMKYEVFVAEQHWPLPADHQSRRAAEDSVDAQSCFVLAQRGDENVGAVRGTMLSAAFPHRELLEHHLRRGGIQLDLAHLATVNAIAVRAELRGRPLVIAGHAAPLTVAKALMCELTCWCREQGALALVFTAIQGVSAVFFEHLGAYVVDPPFRLDGIPFGLVNMALLMTDPQRFAEQQSPLRFFCPPRALTAQEQTCATYCRARQGEILAGRSIEELALGTPSP